MDIVPTIEPLQLRRNWQHRLEVALPRWGAWLEHLSNSLEGFDRWRPTVPEYLVRASANLEAELERYLEMAVNHLHDLWVIQSWLDLPDSTYAQHEPLLMNLLMDAMARCGRMLSPENIEFLPRPSGPLEPQDWLEFLAASEHGRQLLQTLVVDDGSGERLPPPVGLPPLPHEAMFTSAVRSLQAAQSSYTTHLDQKRLIERLRTTMKNSPFNGMNLAHSQVATSLNECEATHVVLE